MSVTVTGQKRHLDLNGATLTTTGNITIGGDILVAEGKAVKLGTGGTFQLWHQSGTNGNSFIDEQTAGELYIRSNSTIRLAHYANNTASANFNPAGAVELYHNTALKFKTEAAGASVTGNFYLTSGNHIHFDNGVSNNYYVRKTSTKLEFKTGGTYDFLTGNVFFNGDVTANKLKMGSTQLYPSGDNNHIHFIGTALIGTSTTASSNPSIGTSTYPFNTMHAGHFYGDGSNLTGITASNADTVDNLHASSFIRSDAADTASGTITFTGGIKSPYVETTSTNQSLFLRPNGSGHVYLGDSGNGNNLYHYSTGNDGKYTTYDWHNNYYRIGSSATNGVWIDDNLRISALDANGNADISGTLAVGQTTINSGSDNIFTLNQTSTDNKWSYIDFKSQGTREWFIGMDASGNFDLYNDNINAYAITVGYTNNHINLKADTVVEGTLDANTLNTGQGDNELYAMNQNVRTTDDVTFDNLTVTGNLSITGDINSYNVTDLDVEDKTITVGSGQNAANSGSSGLIINRSDSTNPSMLWNQTDGRFEFNSGVTVSGQLHTTGSVFAKGALYVVDTDGTNNHIQARSNGTEGFLTVSNGSNWGFIVRGPSNDPRIGAYHGGTLKIEGFHSSDGATGSNAVDLAQFKFADAEFNVNGDITLTGTVDGVDIAALAAANTGTNTGDQDLSGFVTKASAQTISGAKTFTGGTIMGELVTTNHIYGRSVNNQYSQLYRFGGLFLTWDSDSYGTNFHHSITSTDNGTYSDSLTINSFDKVRINIDSNDNDSASTFTIGKHTTGTANTLLTLDQDGDLTITGTFSASGYNNSNWDTAYGWGNHASAGYASSSHNHDDRYYTETESRNKFTTTDATEHDYTFTLDDESNFSGNRWYHLATLNSQNGGLHIRGAILNHVENFASQKIDIAIQVREENDGGQLEITGSLDVLHNATSGTDRAGIRVIKSAENGTYDEFKVYLRVTRYQQVTLRMTEQGTTSFNTSHSSPLTSEPAPVSGGHVELDTSSTPEGNYVIDNSTIKEIYHEGHKPTYSELGNMAYSNLTGVPTVGDGGLTQNNFTNADHSKLDGIAAGADVTPSWVPSSDPGYFKQGSFSAGYTGDMDDLTGLRIIRSTSGSNRAFAAHHNVLTLPNTSASQYGAQIAFETGSVSDGGIKFRNSTNGTFTSWYRLYHEGHKPTLAELGAQASGNYYSSESDVTQHQGALSINYSQLTGTVPTWNQDTTGNATTASSTGLLTDGGGLTTHPGTNNLLFTGQISAGTSGLFSTSDNSNAVITLNRHSGNYNSQLGFSSNGAIYYRKFSNSNNNSQGWNEIAFTNNSGMLNSNVTLSSLGAAAASHNHDDRYYTESEVDGFAVKLTGAQTIAGVKTFNGKTVHNAGVAVGDVSDTTLTRHSSGHLQLPSNVRIFSDNYHPNADGLTTSRTIAGTSFDGTADIDISYANLTNKPTIPTDNADLANGAGYTTNIGDITQVTAGAGLHGGSTSGNATLNLDIDGTNSYIYMNNTVTPTTGDFIPFHDTNDNVVRKATISTILGLGGTQGKSLTSSGNRYDVIPYVASDGVLEVGRYIDFHTSDGSTSDFAHRLTVNGSTLNFSAGIAGSSASFSSTVDMNATARFNFTSGTAGSQFEAASSALQTFRCDSDRYRIYMGSERFTVTNTGRVGINDSTPDYTLDVSGNVSGISIYASHDIAAYSDKRVKKDIETIEDALQKVNKLRGVTFKRKDEESDKVHMGVIAQEVQEVIPEVVTARESDGHLSVSYSNMVGVLIEAVKELTAEVEELKKCKCENCNCK